MPLRKEIAERGAECRGGRRRERGERQPRVDLFYHRAVIFRRAVRPRMQTFSSAFRLLRHER